MDRSETNINRLRLETNMQYRKLKKIDAERFWEMLNQLDHETEYMLYEPGERTKNIAKMEAVIENSVRKMV